MCIQLLNTYMYEQQTSVQPALISARQRAFGQQNQGLFGVNKKLAKIKKTTRLLLNSTGSETKQVSMQSEHVEQQNSNKAIAVMQF